MKICHVITRLVVGGAQENTIFTVNGLKEKGYDVDLVSGPTTGPEGSLEKQVNTEKGISLIIVKELVRNINPVYDIICLFKLIILFRKKRYDIVHTHSAKAGILGRIAAKIACRKTAIIHTVHGLSFHEFQSPLRNILYITAEKIAAIFTDRFICVGGVMKEKSLRAGIGREGEYSIVYSGFDIRPYVEADRHREFKRKSLGIKDNEKVIGMVGRLYHLKGQEYLMEAFAEVVKEHPDTKLLIVGDGILRADLEAFAKENNISRKVIFTGLVPPSEIPGFISAMDILVHTSLREGLPKAVAQGFAGGRPVLAFDVDGAKELVVNDKTGYLIPPKDTSLLTGKINFLLKNPGISYKMGENGRDVVSNLFPVEKMVGSIEKIYMELLEKNGR
ncbi:MAG: glycosyltransferase family 4 protein [Candidatus Omnitrophica bacterium]|nr:glycosyltransferase family 4 protein [Candidatus Omnitrophota bacterium]